jgi:alpha-tubulin suppressor-like RCC1 family protein
MAASPNAAAISAFRAHLSTGQQQSCAIKADRTVACWGGVLSRDDGPHRRPAVVAGLTDVLAVASGDEHNCAIRLDGKALCWGKNNQGQLGDGSKTPSDAPVLVANLADAVALSLGNGFSCALKQDRTVVCWGRNDTGQLGDGSTLASSAPKPVKGLANVTGLFAGAGHACALLASGGVSCWGGNSSGQLGDGTKVNRLTPVAIKSLASGVLWMGVGFSHGCALKSNATLVCWGDNADGQLGNGSTKAATTPVNVLDLTSVSVLAVGGVHNCVVTNPSGATLCWGSNMFGQVGSGAQGNKNRPTPVLKMAAPAALSAGYNHSCAIDANGAAQCWGRNSHGQLGTGRADHEFEPKAVAGGGVYLK